MSVINRDSIIEAVKKPINRVFEALEKLDWETVIAHYYNHPEFRFTGLIFGKIMNLTYEELANAMRGAYESMVEQKMIRETEYFNVLSETKVLYSTSGTGCQIPKEGERKDFRVVVTQLLSLIGEEWKIIHETEATIPKKRE